MFYQIRGRKAHALGYAGYNGEKSCSKIKMIGKIDLDTGRIDSAVLAELAKLSEEERETHKKKIADLRAELKRRDRLAALQELPALLYKVRDALSAPEFSEWEAMGEEWRAEVRRNMSFVCILYATNERKCPPLSSTAPALDEIEETIARIDNGDNLAKMKALPRLIARCATTAVFASPEQWESMGIFWRSEVDRHARVFDQDRRYLEEKCPTPLPPYAEIAEMLKAQAVEKIAGATTPPDAPEPTEVPADVSAGQDVAAATAGESDLVPQPDGSVWRKRSLPGVDTYAATTSEAVPGQDAEACVDTEGTDSAQDVASDAATSLPAQEDATGQTPDPDALDANGLGDVKELARRYQEEEAAQAVHAAEQSAQDAGSIELAQDSPTLPDSSTAEDGQDAPAPETAPVPDATDVDTSTTGSPEPGTDGDALAENAPEGEACDSAEPATAKPVYMTGTGQGARLNDAGKACLAKLKAQGLNYADAARKSGISKSTVRSYFIRLGKETAAATSTTDGQD